MQSSTTRARRRAVVDQRVLAQAIGGRLRAARLRARLTQQELAGDRYTKAYISALELGHAKPSMAALDYLAPRLGTTPDRLLADPADHWSRVDADLALVAGRYAEAAEAYAGLAARETDPGRRAGQLLGVAESRARTGDAEAAAGPAAEALRLFQAAGRASDAKRARYWLAWAHLQEGDADEARRLLREILAAPRAEDDDPDLETRVRIALAQVENRHGDPAKAVLYLEEAHGSVEQLDVRRRAVYFDSLARARQSVGDLEAAVRAGMEALALFRALEATYDEGAICNELAMAFAAMGNLDRADEYALRGRRLFEQAGSAQGLVPVIDTQAMIALERGDPDAALGLADEALRIADEAALADSALGARMSRARALDMLGRHEEAEATWSDAAEIARRLPAGARRRRALTGWADALAAQGRHAEAYGVMREAL